MESTFTNHNTVSDYENEGRPDQNMPPFINHSKLSENFTVIPNDLINDKKLSSDGLALLVTLLSCPPKWKLRSKNIMDRMGWGRQKTYKVIQHLAEVCYIARVRERGDDGMLGKMQYFVYDKPQDLDVPRDENHHMVQTENGGNSPDQPCDDYPRDENHHMVQAENGGNPPDQPRDENHHPSKDINTSLIKKEDVVKQETAENEKDEMDDKLTDKQKKLIRELTQEVVTKNGFDEAEVLVEFNRQALAGQDLIYFKRQLLEMDSLIELKKRKEKKSSYIPQKIDDDEIYQAWLDADTWLTKIHKTDRERTEWWNIHVNQISATWMCLSGLDGVTPVEFDAEDKTLKVAVFDAKYTNDKRLMYFKDCWRGWLLERLNDVLPNHDIKRIELEQSVGVSVDDVA